MKNCFKGFYLSLGMFTAIPLPAHLWGGACMGLALTCLPLVGGLIGALWWGAAELLVFSPLHIVLAAAVLTAVPFFVTGFLHLDGYMDTSDAMLSARATEEKIRILKDPHTGAFAVIMLVVLFLLQFAALYVIIERAANLALLIIIAVISRCCATASILCLDVMRESSYANIFKQNTGMRHKLFVSAVAVLAVASAYLYAGTVGIVTALSVIIGYMCATAYVYKEFKGVSGDLTGFAIVIGELCGLLALAAIMS